MLRTTLASIGGGRDNLLTVREVATRLGVSTATVYDLCAHGVLPHFRLLNSIRIAPADVETLRNKRP